MTNVLNLNPTHHVFQKELGEEVRKAIDLVKSKHSYTIDSVIGVLESIKMYEYLTENGYVTEDDL